MTSQTLITEDSEVDGFLEELAKGITRYIAVDPDVILQNDNMEGGTSLAIDNWADVESTIQELLKVWLGNMADKNSLDYPIPVPIYQLLYLMCAREVSDSRGTVTFKLDYYHDKTPDAGNAAALVGGKGYFTKKFAMLSSNEYLVNGEYKQLKLMVGKENNLEKKGTKQIATDFRKVSATELLNLKRDGKALAGMEGYNPDYTGLPFLVPGLDLKSAHIDKRLITVETVLFAPEYAAPKPIGQAQIAAEWVMSAGHDYNYALRSFLLFEPSSLVGTEMQRSVMVAEHSTPYRDMPAKLELPPHSGNTKRMVELAGLVTNPYLLANTSGEDYEALHTMSNVMTEALAPMALTETIRSQTRRYLTFNSVSQKLTGFTLAMNGQQPLSLSAGSLKKDAAGVFDAIQRWRSVLGSLTNSIKIGPLLSIDRNRVPITVKYCLMVVGENQDDGTGLDVSIAENKALKSGSTILRLVQRFRQEKEDGSGEYNYEDIIEAFAVPTKQERDEFVKACREYFDSIFGTVDAVENPTMSDLVQQVTDTFFAPKDISKYYTGKGFSDDVDSLYVFTKFKEPSLIKAAEKFQFSLHFPVYRGHGLIANGYRKLGRVYVWPGVFVSSANLTDQNGRPRTEYGKTLFFLARNGGFGFGSLLGPLVGQLGGIIGNAVGVPEIGQIAGTVGNIGGNVLDAFL